MRRFSRESSLQMSRDYILGLQFGASTPYRHFKQQTASARDIAVGIFAMAAFLTTVGVGGVAYQRHVNARKAQTGDQSHGESGTIALCQPRNGSSELPTKTFGVMDRDLTSRRIACPAP